MFDPEVFRQREQFCRDVAHVSGEYLKNNAQALFLISNELQRSLMLEFRIIQQVGRLNIDDPQEVENFLQDLEDYAGRTFYQDERTRCHLIAQAWRLQAEPKALGDDAERRAATELRCLINLFSTDDFELIDQVEKSVNAALNHVRALDADIKAGDIDGAKQRQADFVETYKAELERLKVALRQLSETAMNTIAKL